MGEDARVASILDVTSKATGQDVKVAPPIRRNEKENMTEYIGKKREMFLVQMSLDTKREEIRKLEEKAQAKEEALQRSERMLEEGERIHHPSAHFLLNIAALTCHHTFLRCATLRHLSARK